MNNDHKVFFHSAAVYRKVSNVSILVVCVEAATLCAAVPCPLFCYRTHIYLIVAHENIVLLCFDLKCNKPFTLSCVVKPPVCLYSARFELTIDL